MRLEDFDYRLPDRLIAQFPASPRDSARLLVYDRARAHLAHHSIAEITNFLAPDDVMVVNNTKVIPARLNSLDAQGRPIEIFLLHPEHDSSWRCLVKPGRRVKTTLPVTLSDNTKIEIRRSPEALGSPFTVRFPATELPFFDWLARVGTPPIPPYLARAAAASDWSSYQTVFAKESGAVAAPTAGLHFTPALLTEVHQQGVTIASTTLHVGYGTFAPLSEEGLEGTELHAESYSVPESTLKICEEARHHGRRILCVGTTSLRALESAALGGPTGSTRLFIKPGFPFRHANALLTNFHLPKTSLLVLVSAFMGREAALRCYEEAISQDYRFYSYGDAMLVY